MTVPVAIETKRIMAKPSEEAHFCGKCGDIATRACTDAIETAPDTWAVSAERYGCQHHPVVSLIHRADGRVQTPKEYEASLVN